MEGFFCYLAVIWHLSFYIPLSTTSQFSMTFRQPGFISVNLWNKKRKLEHVNYMQCHRLQFSSNIWKVVRFSVKYMCMWESGNQHYVLGCDTEGGFYRVWRYEDLETAETKMKIWEKKYSAQYSWLYSFCSSTPAPLSFPLLSKWIFTLVFCRR